MGWNIAANLTWLKHFFFFVLGRSHGTCGKYMYLTWFSQNSLFICLFSSRGVPFSIKLDTRARGRRTISNHHSRQILFQPSIQSIWKIPQLPFFCSFQQVKYTCNMYLASRLHLGGWNCHFCKKLLFSLISTITSNITAICMCQGDSLDQFIASGPGFRYECGNTQTISMPLFC